MPINGVRLVRSTRKKAGYGAGELLSEPATGEVAAIRASAGLDEGSGEADSSRCVPYRSARIV